MLYIPNKVINATANSVTPYGYWEYDDGSGDPYWSGGPVPKPYQWEIEVSVSTQSHSSHKTRVPGIYNGIDINVGDWIASKTDGMCLIIRSVLSKSENLVVLVVEDYLRYNTFLSQSNSGVGIFSIPSEVVIFEVNENYEPKLSPAPNNVSPTFFLNVDGRFKTYPTDSYVFIEQENNEFNIGDIISVNPSTNSFVTYDIDNNMIVGEVISKGPTLYGNIINPISKIIDLDSIIGNKGDIIYMNDNGGFTTNKTSKAIYVKLTEYSNSYITGNVSNGTTDPNNSLVINNISLQIGGSGSIDDIVSSINSSPTSVSASKTPAPTEVANTTSYPYGQPGAFISNNPTIQINGVVVTLLTTTAGDEQYPTNPNLALEEDIATDINNANIPDIIAETPSTNQLVIKNTSGGTIEIVNIDSDDNGNPIFSPNASTSSCTGIVEGLYGPSTENYLMLENNNASEIILTEPTSNNGSVLSDFGIYSVDNGIPSKVLYIEQGLRKGDVYSVLDNTQRLSLDVIVGDGAYVEDGGNGEWQYWLYTSSGWELIATEDSARTDADVLSLELTSADSGTHLVGTVSNNSRVTNVTVEVTQAFDDINSTLNIGDTTVNDRLMSEDIIDLTEVGTYTFTPSYVYDDGSDTDLNAYLNTGTSTVGALKIIISYS